VIQVKEHQTTHVQKFYGLNYQWNIPTHFIEENNKKDTIL
jgi:hypothetical protein